MTAQLIMSPQGAGTAVGRLSADDPIANVARGWRRPAAASAKPSPHFSVSAAIWSETGDGVSEVAAAATRDTYVLAFTDAALSADVFIDGRRVFSGVAPPGSCNLVQPGQTPRGLFAGRWRVLHLYMPGDLLRQVVDDEGLPPELGRGELVNPLWTIRSPLRQIARELAGELAGGQAFGRLKLDALGLGCTVELLRSRSPAVARTIASQGSGGLAAWQLKRACEAMDAHLHEDIGLRALAEIAGCSPTHFSRAFKRSTGVPPFRWLLDRRIARAKELLADPRATLVDIALAVGFSAQPQFTTAFRRVTGTTPGAWRREQSF